MYENAHILVHIFMRTIQLAFGLILVPNWAIPSDSDERTPTCSSFCESVVEMISELLDLLDSKGKTV
jgi:hypothetical protein